ncbi:unnamed protein product, partial [Polarella glacialis]
NLIRELGFDVAILLEPPHRYVLEYVDALKRPPKLAQKAWSYVNDSLRTTLSCSHQPDEIAAASIFLAARTLKLKLPSKPSWWEAVGAKTKDVERLARTMMSLYSKGPAKHIAILPRRKAVPEPMTPSMTPFPETPAPCKSPS